MVEYAHTTGQDRNSFYSNPHIMSPHYTNGNGVNYFYPNAHLQQSPTDGGSYSAYGLPYVCYQTNPSMYMSTGPSTRVPYSLAPPSRPYQSSSRSLSYPFQPGTVPTQRLTTSHQQPRIAYHSELPIPHPIEIEDQESINESTMLSEPIVPALEGYPDVQKFDQLLHKYAIPCHNLSSLNLTPHKVRCQSVA
jgi:hypothetical protein